MVVGRVAVVLVRVFGRLWFDGLGVVGDCGGTVLRPAGYPFVVVVVVVSER